MGSRLALIGVPTNSSGTRGGVARAPAALRAAGLVKALERAGLAVADYGDLPLPTPSTERSARGILAEAALVRMVQAVQDATHRAFIEGRFPVVIGGDCPLLLGCLAAARAHAGRTALLFVDGHEDAYAPWQSPTGEAADMELAFALGREQGALPSELAAKLPLLGPRSVTLLGPRDGARLAAEGVASLRGGVRLLDAAALRAADLTALTRNELTRLRADAPSWWLHLDLDVLSSAALGAVDYPQEGGLSWTELSEITREALATPGLLGLNLTIYNPELDPSGAGAARIVAYLAEQCAQLR